MAYKYMALSDKLTLHITMTTSITDWTSSLTLIPRLLFLLKLKSQR